MAEYHDQNLVFKHDEKTGIIRPIYDDTGAEASEIGFAIQQQNQQQAYHSGIKGMIRNVKRAHVVSKRQQSVEGTHTDPIPKYDHNGTLYLGEDVSTYHADFVIDVFVVPDEDEYVEDVREKLDAWLDLNPLNAFVQNQTNELIRSFGIPNIHELYTLDPEYQTALQDAITNIPNTTEYIFFKRFLNRTGKSPHSGKEERYFNNAGSIFEYVEKLNDTDDAEDNIWVLHPKFDSFRLPFKMYFRNKDPQYHLLHLNMKYVVKILNREEAKKRIETNDSISNFFVFLVNDFTPIPPAASGEGRRRASRSTNIDSRNLFDGSNLVVMSSEQLSRYNERLFFHEIAHTLFKYNDPAVNSLEYGEHNQIDDNTYMNVPNQFATTFTVNDLLALTVPKRNETYGEMIDKISGNTNAKNTIASNMKYKEFITNKQGTYLATISEAKKEYLKVFKDNQKKLNTNLFLFKMYVQDEHPITTTDPYYITLNDLEKVKLYNIELKNEIMWPNEICDEFIFFNHFVDDLLIPNIDTIEKFKAIHPENTWPEKP